MKNLYFIEHTDTFGGEANYSWLRRYIVVASSERGAMRKVSALAGVYWEAQGHGRYDSKSGCSCFFVEKIDTDDAARLESQYSWIDRI